MTKRLYLGVDGVLLDRAGNQAPLAPHASRFIEFAVANFECFWLTPHCQGDNRTVLNYLARFASPELLRTMSVIKPTRFGAFKTEALAGDFYWIEDNPMAAEITALCRRKALDRWIRVNTRVNPDDLLRAIDLLQNVLMGGPRRIPADPLQAAGEIA